MPFFGGTHYFHHVKGGVEEMHSNFIGFGGGHYFFKKGLKGISTMQKGGYQIFKKCVTRAVKLLLDQFLMNS